MRFIIALLLLAPTALADEPATQPADPTARTTTRPATTQAGEQGDKIVVTTHSLTVGEKTLKYTAATGTMAQKDESGATKADMFFDAYTLDGTKPAERPITFVFNGGP